MKSLIKKGTQNNCCPIFTLAISQTIYYFKAKLTDDLVFYVKNFRHVWRTRLCLLNSGVKRTLQLCCVPVLSACGMGQCSPPSLGFGLLG